MSSITKNVKGESDDDAPLEVTFKDQAYERAKSEKAVNTSIQVAKQKAKASRRVRQMLKGSKHCHSPSSQIKNEVISAQPGKMKTEVEILIDESKRKEVPYLENIEAEEEFKLTDTFDYRKYLPSNLLKDVDEFGEDMYENEYFDSEEEEIAQAILENGIDMRDDSSDIYEQDNKTVTSKPKKKKKKQVVIPSKTGVDANLGKKRRRGGRRFHVKYSSAPRVVILNNQDATATIRQRADEFVNQRLFGSSTGVGKSSIAPRRMTLQEIAQISAKIKARNCSWRHGVNVYI